MDSCWYWAGSLDAYGYAEKQIDRKKYKVHRLMYEDAEGDIPKGLVIDHLCRVRHCINPDHMEVVTNKENVLRGEGLTARQARQTHCKNGHEFTAVNTRTSKGKRYCRECARDYYQTIVRARLTAFIGKGEK